MLKSPNQLKRASLLLVCLVATGSAGVAGGGFQPTPESEADRLFAQGRSLFLEGETSQAGEVFRRLLPMLREREDLSSLASVLNALSVIDSAEGAYSQAAAYAREAASIRESLQDPPGRADSLTNLGLALSHLGNYDAALQSYREALALYEADGDLEGVTLLRNNIGSVLLYQGRYGAAFDEYQKALQTCLRLPDADWSRHQRSRTMVNLAALHQKIGAYDRALELYSSLGDSQTLSISEEARRLSNQGALYRHLGDAVKAMEAYREALKHYRTDSDLDGEIGVLKNIGIALALDLGDLAGALTAFGNALSLALDSGNHREILQTRLYRAEALRRLGRTDEAARELKTVADGAVELAAVEEEWKALYGLGRLAEAEGRFGEAQKLLQSAVQRIESVQSRLRLPSLTRGFLAGKRQVYDALIDLMIGGEAPPALDASAFFEVLRLVEKARSQPFRDFLSEETANSPKDPEGAGQLRELRGRAAALWQRQLRASPDQRRQLMAQLADVENQYLALESRGASSSQINPELPSLPQIQSRLPRASLLLAFWMGESRAAVLAISRIGFHLHTLKLRPGDRASISRCARDLGDPSAADWRTSCEPVAGLFLANLPIFRDGLQRLVLVLDRPLDSIPFEALPFESGLLLEALEVEYLPGLAFLGARRDGEGWSRRTPWANSLLAFGAPTPSRPVSIDEFGEAWPQLPFAKNEIESAVDLLPGIATMRLGAAARKADLLAGLAKDGYPIVHLATHATADPEDPELSRILLASSNPETAYEFLFLGEVLSLDLRDTNLVVLSACETGRGGARLPGASRDFGEAFLRAGAGAVAVTLWRVSDEATASFMQGFYSGLADGEPPMSALRRAKLRFYTSGKSVQHPYFWAGFVLHGDGSTTVPLPFGWLPIAAALTLLAAAIWTATRIAANRAARKSAVS